MKITNKKNITRNLDMKVNLRGGGQINLKPLAQIADSVEPKNYRDITVTGLTTKELDSEAVKNSIRTYGLSEEEIKKIPHIDFNSLGSMGINNWDINLAYYAEFNPINSDTFPTVEGSAPLTTSSILNTEYISYGGGTSSSMILKQHDIEQGQKDGVNYKTIAYCTASEYYPQFYINFYIEDNLFKTTTVSIGSDA